MDGGGEDEWDYKDWFSLMSVNFKVDNGTDIGENIRVLFRKRKESLGNGCWVDN